MRFNHDLTGKTAVVTGAGGVLCSMFAQTLAQNGATVALLDINYDAAKAAALLAANPQVRGNDIFDSSRFGHRPMPLLLIGTTAGTGSEVTAVSVLTTTSRPADTVHPAGNISDRTDRCACHAAGVLP